MLPGLDQFADFTRLLCERSGDVIRPYFASSKLDTQTKSDGSPVTLADREAESVMRDLIQKHHPSHGIIGEEFGNHNKGAEFTWVLDPIDGTVSFAHASPLFGTLIALMHQGQPVLGAIHQPILRQLCLGDGETTTLNGEPVQMRDTLTLSESTLLGTDLAKIDEYQDYAGFERLRHQTKVFRTWGDCYGYLMLAAGWADVMIDPIMNPWDILPLVPIIRGAGGVITTWEGGDPVQGSSSVAATKRLHGEVLALLRSDRET